MAIIHNWMRRQEFNQMRCHCNRPHTRATSSMRDSKSFMQVQMTNIGTNHTGRSKSYLSIHISAIHINLSSVFMNNSTHLRSEEHTSELQSRPHLVCRLLLEKKKNKKIQN